MVLAAPDYYTGELLEKTLFPNGELNLLSPGSGCPLQSGTGRGDIFAASRGGGAGCGQQDILLSSDLLLLSGDVSCGAAESGRSSAGAGPGCGLQPAVCCGAAVLRRRWPPSPCRDAAPCGLSLDTGGVVWCCCGVVTHALLSVSALNLGQPSSVSSSTSGLSSPVLPRRLWLVVCWVGFLSDVISGVESVLWEGGYPALTLAPTCEENQAS